MNTNRPPSNRPASFLFTTWEGGGVVSPTLTVARKLLARGHRVRLMSDEANRPETETSGVEFRPWKNAPNRPDRERESCPLRDWEAATAQAGVALLIDRIMLSPAADYAADVLAELEREPADVVIASEMLPGVMAACESVGQPFAIFAANLCLYPVAGMPLFGPGLPPARTQEEEALHAEIRAGITTMFDAGLEGFNRARASLGLAPLEHVADQADAADLYLLGTARAFDFPVKRLPERIHYVGPQLDEPAWAEPWTSPWDAGDPRPLVVAGFSTTFQDHAGVLQNVIDACAGLPVRLLVTLGAIHAGEIQPRENTVIVSSAPHDAVMKEASVVVTHGGHGTVMRALAHQRPMLVLPHGRDQDDNAVRITERGAGLSLPATAATGVIHQALRRLLEEPSFTTAARCLGSAVADEMSASPVVELLEQLASAPGSPRAGGSPPAAGSRMCACATV